MAMIEHVMRLRSELEAHLLRISLAATALISVLVPTELRLSVAELDRLRAEIGEAIGGAGPNRWLTIIFTGDAAQL
jgi:predicted Co/Zn/Cd cation transporter (cation efflux family)